MVARGEALGERAAVDRVGTAVEYGALAANRVRVTDFVKTDGRVSGAEVTDLESGEDFTIKAKHVIAAAGVWTEATQDLAEAQGGLKVLASKGIHIVVPKERLNGEVGFILQTEKSVLFIIPWERYWVIGTTDTPYEQDYVHPVASQADIDYVIDHANVVLQKPITRDDVIGTWAGLRPLLQPATKGDGTASTKVSREHTVTEAAPGLVTIAGGKLTTYRVMAEDAVDFALGEAQAKARPSQTKKTPLMGAAGFGSAGGRDSESGAVVSMTSGPALLACARARTAWLATPGSAAQLETQPECPCIVASALPLSRSHSFSVASYEADTARPAPPSAPGSTALATFDGPTVEPAIVELGRETSSFNGMALDQASWNSARLPKVGASVVTVHALSDEMPPESAT